MSDKIKLAINHYLDSDEWFLISTKSHDIKTFEIVDSNVEHFDTENAKFKVTIRFDTIEDKESFMEAAKRINDATI